MTTYVALLRGINLGGKRRVAMADLKAVVADAGGERVTTYIQSGNVVFAHRSHSADELGARLEQAIEAAVGFPVPVILRTAREWEEVVAANPYPGVEPTTLHVAFLAGDPAPGAADPVDRAAFAPETFEIVGRQVYMHLPSGMGRSKLPQALEVIGVPATVRNWRTVTKLAELAAG